MSTYVQTHTASGIEINKVLRNTYILLSLTLFVAAATGWYAMASGAGVVNFWLFLAFAMGMPFLISMTANSPLGLVMCFVYTAGLGYVAGPIVGMYAKFIGPEVPIYAFATTALAFVGLSAYAIISKRDFSFLRSMLVVSSICVLATIVAMQFFNMPIVGLLLSGVIVVLSSLGILYSTSAAINGGEDNYIVLTASIFGNLWSMFMNLMQIFGIFGGDD